jgi:hypothetical protein
MKITKKQKAYVGALVVGLAAFMADRTLFAPAEAQADVPVTAQPQKQRKSPVVQGKTATELPAGDEALSQSLRSVAMKQGIAAGPVRDAFAPARAWVGEEPVGRDTTADRIEAFRQKHRLTAVLVIPGASQAIINGNAVKVGQAVDGFVLESLSDKRAVFRGGKAVVELILDPRADAVNKSE